MSARQELTLKTETSGPLERVLSRHTSSHWKTPVPGARSRHKTVEWCGLVQCGHDPRGLGHWEWPCG